MDAATVSMDAASCSRISGSKQGPENKIPRSVLVGGLVLHLAQFSRGEMISKLLAAKIQIQILNSAVVRCERRSAYEEI